MWKKRRWQVGFKKWQPEVRQTCFTNCIRELKQWRRRSQSEREKSNRFRLAKQQLCMCIPLFSTFLCCRSTTKPWKYLISRFVEDRTTRQGLSFPKTLIRSLEFSSRKICEHLTNWMSWNYCDKLWSSAKSFLKWRIRSRRRRYCFSSLFANWQMGGAHIQTVLTTAQFHHQPNHHHHHHHHHYHQNHSTLLVEIL